MSDDDTAIREWLLEDGADVQSLDDLIGLCLPTVTARLWATCCWPRRMGRTWKVGDFRYVIFSLEPDEETSLYVQFWSEPHEVVSAEVSSGNWTPGALRYLAAEARARIEAFGYQEGGNAGNYQKEVAITSPAEAEAAAREVLAIMFEAFGYRGQWPLQIERNTGERSRPAVVYDSLTPEDLAKLAAEVGYDPSIVSEPVAVVLLQRGRRRTGAMLRDQVPENNLFGTIVLRTLIGTGSRADHALLAALSSELPGSRLGLDADNDIYVEHHLQLAGGVTADWIMVQLRQWDAVHRAAERLLRRARKQKPARPVRPTTH
jgi:hypothetical protein